MAKSVPDDDDNNGHRLRNVRVLSKAARRPPASANGSPCAGLIKQPNDRQAPVSRSAFYLFSVFALRCSPARLLAYRKAHPRLVVLMPQTGCLHNCLPVRLFGSHNDRQKDRDTRAIHSAVYNTTSCAINVRLLAGSRGIDSRRAPVRFNGRQKSIHLSIYSLERWTVSIPRQLYGSGTDLSKHSDFLFNSPDKPI